MKGVILTAGNATRLRPITNVYGKVLVPIYDKPMIEYGVSLLLKCGIREIAIVCNPSDLPNYKRLFDNKFEKYGVHFELFIQKQALGTAHALKPAAKFVGDDEFVVLFGDNIFVMDNMDKLLTKAIQKNTGVTLFAKRVPDPQRFGIIEHDKNFNIVDLQEKPLAPKTNLAATGLYVFEAGCMQKIFKIKKSVRGEYELNDLITEYIKNKKAKVNILDDSCRWLDTGTFDALLNCSQLVKDFEEKHGLFGSIELELYRQKIITKTELNELCKIYRSDYTSRMEQTIKLWKNKK